MIVKDSTIQRLKLEELKKQVINQSLKVSEILAIMQCKYWSELKLILKKIHDRQRV